MGEWEHNNIGLGHRFGQLIEKATTADWEMNGLKKEKNKLITTIISAMC